MTIENILKDKLLEIENPSRYFPCEYIKGKKSFRNGMIKSAICFPDLYEIGMSNNSIKIIYNQLNNCNDIYCDRLFSVAPDFENLLRENNVPLFTVEQNFNVKDLDFLGFTISTELAGTNILQVLDLSNIPFHAKDRTDSDPIIIAGGPASTNPLPFSEFFDFVYIGESEAYLNDIVHICGEKISRSEKLSKLKNFDCLWYYGKKSAIRAVNDKFGKEDEVNHIFNHYAVSSFEVVQDHGTAEIMRGCPNGCRFCHAGQYYKPFRQRNIKSISDIVRQNVEEFGYREITLSSLSSGDYPNLDNLIKILNSQYKNRNISFSLPSLKVSTFSLDILEQISEVRKSGLTFAVETPLLNDQRALNKEVYVNQLIDIILVAKQRGWKLAKFYFMVGLPFVDFDTEEKNIVDFLSTIRNATKINMNINIGTFIPKAHTPFQWVRQLTLEESNQHLKSIKKALVSAIPGIKVSYHEPYISFLEGLISRSDISGCKLIEKAYESGCRLDAWDEYLDIEKWNKAIESSGFDIEKRSFDINDELPWDNISMNVSKSYLLKEYENASKRIITDTCSENCKHKCGVCSKVHRTITADNSEIVLDSIEKKDVSDYQQVIIEYSKQGRAVLNSHMAVMRQFEMAFQRSGLNIKFTEGYNPKPKMEFLNPLSMGVYGNNELLLCELPESEINDSLIEKMNNNLATGFLLKRYKIIRIPESGKKISLASNLISSEYSIEDIKDNKISDALNNCNNEYFKASKTENGYKLVVKGEKNLFKGIFGEEMNKFYIASHCKITRTVINLASL